MNQQHSRASLLTAILAALLLAALAASYQGMPAGAGPPLGDMAELATRVLGEAFAGLRGVSERVRRITDDVGPELSMGMTNDMEIAIREGSTMVRIGTALFGER